MAILHVRNVPEDLYRRLKVQADAQRRSISAQVIAMIDEAVSRAESRQETSEAVLKRIRSRRNKIKLPKDWPGVVKLLREDRGRYK